jgi:hypothetical protein
LRRYEDLRSLGELRSNTKPRNGVAKNTLLAADERGLTPIKQELIGKDSCSIRFNRAFIGG